MDSVEGYKAIFLHFSLTRRFFAYLVPIKPATVSRRHSQCSNSRRIYYWSFKEMLQLYIGLCFISEFKARQKKSISK